MRREAPLLLTTRADCASVLFKSSRWTAVSEIWSAVDGCFYSDEWDRMWECADLALWYWFDAHVPRSNAYRTMDFVRKEMRGFILTDYADGIGNVQDADSAARTNAKLLDRYIDDWDRRGAPVDFPAHARGLRPTDRASNPSAPNS